MSLGSAAERPPLRLGTGVPPIRGWRKPLRDPKLPNTSPNLKKHGYCWNWKDHRPFHTATKTRAFRVVECAMIDYGGTRGIAKADAAAFIEREAARLMKALGRIRGAKRDLPSPPRLVYLERHSKGRWGECRCGPHYLGKQANQVEIYTGGDWWGLVVHETAHWVHRWAEWALSRPPGKDHGEEFVTFYSSMAATWLEANADD